MEAETDDIGLGEEAHSQCHPQPPLMPFCEEQYPVLSLRSNDILTHPYVLRYIDFYNNYGPEGRFSMEELSLMYGNSVCSICRLNAMVDKGSNFHQWIKTFARAIQFKSIFCKSTSVFAGLYWHVWLIAKGCIGNERVENDLLQWITPESFVIHFCILRCQLVNDDVENIRDQRSTETSTLADMIGLYNSVIACQQWPQTQMNVDDQSDLEGMAYLVKNVGKSWFQHSWMKRDFCKGQCLATTKVIVNKILDLLYPKHQDFDPLHGKQQMLLMAQHRYHSPPHRVQRRKIRNNSESQGSNFSSDSDLGTNTEYCLDIIDNIVGYSRVKKHSHVTEGDKYSRLSLIRGNPPCLFNHLYGKDKRLALERISCDEEQRTESRKELEDEQTYILNPFPDCPKTSVSDSNKHLYAPEECILCNMLNFRDWYEVIEIRVLEMVIGPLCHKNIATPNIFYERLRVLARKAKNGPCNPLYKFLFVEIDPTVFYNHATRSPQCAIDRQRAHVAYGRANSLSCGKTINYAMMYMLFVRGRNTLRLTCSIDRVIEALQNHGIYSDQQAISRASM